MPPAPLNRRQFLRVVCATPAAFSFGLARATQASTKLALVIGNGSYPRAPLANSTNDARDFGALLESAGFAVDRHFDASRQTMLTAIDRFAQNVGRDETELGLFYYAGHGAQLDWQNYLLPVDALVSTGEEMQARCIELGRLLNILSRYKSKTFVIILDACRDDPFGGTYRPPQKGLSQFDAPAGSLLAYATSPGSVAFDGTGRNGLYTENLLREFAAKGVRIEDALKRVRLNVRLGSHGIQIPWETTSLETDVYIFSEGAKNLSAEEIEKQLEGEMAEWSRIKNSRDVADWVGYLRTYPDGRFAEIAQNRLNRLLAESEKSSAPTERPPIAAVSPPPAGPIPSPAVPLSAVSTPPAVPPPAPILAAAPSAPVVPAPTDAYARPLPPRADPSASSAPGPAAAPPAPLPAPGPATAVVAARTEAQDQTKALTPSASESTVAPTRPLGGIELKAGTPSPQLFQQSPNPHSAGRFPLGRKFTLGDQVTFRNLDAITNVETGRTSFSITKVDEDADRVEANGGKWVYDMMGNELVSPHYGVSDVPRGETPNEFYVGNSWRAGWKQIHPEFGLQVITFDFRIAALEKITVPAGEFEAFRIDGTGWISSPGRTSRGERHYWLVPGMIVHLRKDAINVGKGGKMQRTTRQELVYLRQQGLDAACTSQGSGTGTLLIPNCA